ncbi:hypothetical protein FQR65_LT14484 [Abscondita terminalis]|nr:hypothetical protein FQR65_LT14484 [Abscondita terminalis]
MAKWNSGSESGILRKRIQKEKHEELLVFGYACKLFRDDVKALYVDQGKHLIPWMGEESLKIDRYDCRGALSELRQYEANYDSKSSLSETEKRLEILCDEERYYSLKNNEEELEMYKEEEFKRLHQKGNEIEYNYDVPVRPPDCEVSESTPDDQVFVPPPELNLPDDIELVNTIKTNARIEKTALFISKQGPQMEILIKTKQADNPQFNFLNKDDRLHKYYQFLLSAIKSGQYKCSFETADNRKSEEVCDEEENGDHYLHPSLLTTTLQSAPPPPLPAVPYKPSADCKYSQLVNRIQGVQTESVPSPPQPPDINYDQYYQQYYYAAQYYEYYKQMTQQFSETPQDAKGVRIPFLMSFINLLRISDAYAFQSQIYAQYLQQQQNNPYAQIVSNLSQNKEQSPPEPVSNNTVVDKPLLSLVQYGSDSENECSNEVESDNVTVPPSEAEQIITKMASYVVKNGRDFENIVKSKGDSRFHFLNENHEYHLYYRLKVKKFLNDFKDSPVKASKEKKVITPVSFSIKKSKEDTQKEIKSALPVEESDDDGNSPAAVDNSEALSMTPPPRVPQTPTPPPIETTAVTEAEDLILEMIDLTDDLEDKRESRRAEDRKKDKIASAAREKLALQLERKKKAAAFLKLKSAKNEESDQKKTRKREVEVLKIDDSESEEGEIKRHKKSSKKKKSHKRKRSKMRHESKGRQKNKEHKRSKKKRKRSHSRSSKSSDSSE